MSNSEYKTKQLAGLQPSYPAIGGLAPLTRARWTPLGALMRAQDSVPAQSRRLVAEVSLSGAQDWAQPNGSMNPTPGGATPRAYPTDAWRTLASLRARVTPGCELRAHVLFCPSGLVQKGAGPFDSDGAWGEARVGVTWVNGGSSVGPIYESVILPGSGAGTYTGAELSQNAANWNALDEREIAGLRPTSFDTDAATQGAYSEWSDARITIAVRGGARVVHVAVYEYPLAHTTEHDNAGLTSVHAMPPGTNPLTPRPMTKATDGASFDENRFGTLRLAQVAERQSERLGPRVLHISSYDESTHDTLNDTENDPFTTTSATLVGVYDGATSYSVGRAGHAVAGAHALLDRLAGPFIAASRFGVVPVRVRVDASQVGGGTGTVRVQCGLYEWVDVSITGARAIYEMVGTLQCQATPDDAAPPLLVFFTSGNAARTLSVFNISIDFGDWA
jgi:hypothetical protein